MYWKISVIAVKKAKKLISVKITKIVVILTVKNMEKTHPMKC